jgi:hypothetical protein
VVRARIVLLAADGQENTAIARRLAVHVGVVSKWRKRFALEGLGGLADRKRTGRPRVFPAPVVAQVKAMACEPPEAREVPLSRWSSADLAVQAVAEGLVESVSASTVRNLYLIQGSTAEPRCVRRQPGWRAVRAETVTRASPGRKASSSPEPHDNPVAIAIRQQAAAPRRCSRRWLCGCRVEV